jgi:prevent-host-death family protein
MAVKVGVHEAKTTLSKLLAAAEAGEEVIILRGKRPAVKLVPVGDRRPGLTEIIRLVHPSCVGLHALRGRPGGRQLRGLGSNEVRTLIGRSAPGRARRRLLSCPGTDREQNARDEHPD